jgi:hypothetical protein
MAVNARVVSHLTRNLSLAIANVGIQATANPSTFASHHCCIYAKEVPDGHGARPWLRTMAQACDHKGESLMSSGTVCSLVRMPDTAGSEVMLLWGCHLHL